MNLQYITTIARETAWAVKFTLRIVSTRTRTIYSLLVASVLSVALPSIAPIATQKLFDRISDGVFDSISFLFIIATISSAFLSSYISSIRQGMTNEIGIEFNRRLSRRMYLRLINSKKREKRNQSGDVINLFNEMSRISSYFFSTLPTFSFMFASAGVSLAVAVYYDYLVAGSAVVAALLALSFSQGKGARIGEVTKGDFPIQSRRQALISETARNLDAIRTHGAEGYFFSAWNAVSNEALRSKWTINDTIRIYGLYMGLGSQLTTLVVILVGCLRVYQGDLSIGGLLAIQMLMNQALMPLVAASSTSGQWQMAMVAVREVAKFLGDRERRPAFVVPANDVLPRIRVEDVSMTYPGAANPALSNISVALPETGVLAVVGKNGSGKTSLMRILLGLERDFTGSVLVNGAEIRTVSQRWLRNRMAVVDQEATLFSGTVRQNLEVGLDRPPSLREVEGALEFASAGRFVQALPGGLDYELTEGAQNLSGGQRQRLAVARAVLRAPAIAVFDEPTSALDSEAAVEMERKLIAWGRDRLVLIVTHHLFTARVSDSIIVLDQGRLASVGGHDQLLASCNVYRTLWNDYNRA